MELVGLSVRFLALDVITVLTGPCSRTVGENVPVVDLFRLGRMAASNEDDAKVAFMAGRINATRHFAFQQLLRTFECVTISSVRTNRHIPFRKVGH